MAKGDRCVRQKDRETCVMQKVEPVLDVIQKERQMERHTGEPCAVKAASTVRRGAVGKVQKQLACCYPQWSRTASMWRAASWSKNDTTHSGLQAPVGS